MELTFNSIVPRRWILNQHLIIQCRFYQVGQKRGEFEKNRENWTPSSLPYAKTADDIPLQPDAHPLSNDVCVKLKYLLGAQKKIFSCSTSNLRPPQYDSMNLKKLAKNISFFRIRFLMQQTNKTFVTPT